MDTGYETDITRTLQPEEALQKASDVLFSDSPSDESVRYAQACISLARELRIGRKNRYSGYSSVEKVLTLPPHVHTPAPVGVTQAVGPVDDAELGVSTIDEGA
jgi:hypothetical protein